MSRWTSAPANTINLWSWRARGAAIAFTIPYSWSIAISADRHADGLVIIYPRSTLARDLDDAAGSSTSCRARSGSGVDRRREPVQGFARIICALGPGLARRDPVLPVRLDDFFFALILTHRRDDGAGRVVTS